MGPHTLRSSSKYTHPKSSLTAPFFLLSPSFFLASSLFLCKEVAVRYTNYVCMLHAYTGALRLLPKILIDDDAVAKKASKRQPSFYLPFSQAPGSGSDYPMPLVSALRALAWWTGYVCTNHIIPVMYTPRAARYYTWCESVVCAKLEVASAE